jgi:hypothetical protein
VAKVFPNAEAVNDSFRALAGIVRRQHETLAGKLAGCPKAIKATQSHLKATPKPR